MTTPTHDTVDVTVDAIEKLSYTGAALAANEKTLGKREEAAALRLIIAQADVDIAKLQNTKAEARARLAELRK